MRRVLLAAVAAGALHNSTFAQTTFATITGLVTDPHGAVMVGTIVTATRVDNNYVYTAKSNDSGYYSIGQLLEGEYVVRAEAPGFKTFVIESVRLADQELRRLDIRMEIGTIATTVEVKGGASLIETEKARISDTKDANIIKNLPLNQRSLWDFVGQNPGIVQAASGTATRRFSGSRNNQSDASVDGITISNGRDGTQITPLVNYVESMAEVRVDMANNTAEFGALGQVTVISKSGTNELHGSAFDYYQTPIFVSRNPFASSGSAGITHSPGATIGGPVWFPHLYNGKNKTFFFFSYETTRGSQVHDLVNPTVPLASWRQGIFTSTPGSVTIKNPFAAGSPAFAGNTIPTAQLNPVAQKIQDLFYPLPNFGNTSVFQSQNYRQLLSREFDPSIYWTSRIDHRFSERDFVFGRFTWAKQYTRTWDDNLPTIGRIQNVRENQGANISYSRTFRPNLLNEFRWGFAYNDQPRNGAQNGPAVVEELGLQGLAPNLPDVAGIFQVAWSGLGLQSITQQVWRHPGFKNKVFQFQDDMSWFRGRHTLKAGFVVARTYYADGQVPTAGSLVSGGSNLFGSAQFSNKYTGFAYSDFLLGIPTTTARSFPNFVDHELRWSYDLFITDEFKFSPTLTFDLGMRYELHPSAVNTDGYNSIFDIGSGKIVVPDGSMSKVSAIFPQNYVGIETASQAGLPNSLVRTDKNNFAPRIGVAWRPFGNNTVFRGGFGIFYDIVPETSASNSVPFALDQPSYTNPTTPNVILPLVYPSTTAGPSTVTLPTAVNPDIKIPYSMQYNATVEHQQGSTAFRLSYIGTNTRHGDYMYNINQPLPSTTPYVNKPRAFPAYPAINYLTNGAGHQYNAMTAEVKRRGAQGLTYQLSYTLARDIGDLERGQAPENAYDRARERGPWIDIPTHTVTGNLIWDVPVGRGKRFLSNSNAFVNVLASGWSTSLIYTYRRGRFLSPQWTGPDPTNTAFTSSTTPANVTIRPDILVDPNLPAGQRTVNEWFDVNAFTKPAAGRFGTSGPGVIIGPPVNVWDAGIFKAFPIKERVSIRWEITAINVLNHPNWSDPNTNISQTGNAGVISSVGSAASNVSGAGNPLDPSGARAFRTGLRIEF
ncbi:MAG: carboxypeptidase regulatory-like domain-containing protein [Acidobacteriaceae bacterium]|nr:carboxypeptidase regulatory-like domain-containing protein [Acidobacteriaceae bacterium]